jgi:hypothetical protein
MPVDGSAAVPLARRHRRTMQHVYDEMGRGVAYDAALATAPVA